MLLGEETVRIDDPKPPGDNEIVDALRKETTPEGETVEVRESLPDSQLTVVRTRLELEEAPGGTEREAGLAEIAKSTTWTVTWSE